MSPPWHHMKADRRCCRLLVACFNPTNPHEFAVRLSELELRILKKSGELNKN